MSEYDINKKTYPKTQVSFLHLAAKRNDFKEVERLLSHGMNVDLVDKYDRTPLHYAAAFNLHGSHTNTIKVLLSEGANVNARTMSGKNLLHNSVQKADVKSIRLLLDLEAYPTTMDQGIEVIEIREDDPVRMLLDYGFDINQRDWNGSTLLHLAAESNWLNSHLEVIQVLLKCGADVHARDKFGSTPLHLLVCTADTEVVRLFLKFGADVDVENLEGKTPLFEAVRFRNIKVAKLLVDNGADVNVVSYSGATPLEAACNLMSQHPDMFKLLVRSGASIEAVGRELFHNSKASLEVLLKYSDVNRVDENGKNILSIHPQSKNWKTALEHLAKMQALDLDVNTSLLDTISSRDDYSFYFVQCEEELLTAKRIKLRDCWVTFFNLLTD